MSESNPNARLETFCDGVFAIAMTLLVIDVKLPHSESVRSTADVWRALRHLWPTVFAFLLSFIVILITWVNHHGLLRLVHKSCAGFIYANGFLLMTVVFIPFPTSLLGEFVGTAEAAPAVVLYNAVIVVQSLGWILLTGSAIEGGLVRDDMKALTTMRESRRNGYVAFGFYGALAVAAWWFPNAVAAVTTLSWIFWLVLGIRMKHA